MPVYAAVSGGAGHILLSPANTTLPIGAGTPVDILFNTANVPVSGIQVVATFNVANPVDLTATIQTNSALSDDGWSFPIKTVTTTGNTTTVQIMALNLNADGYAVNSNTKLATITFTSAHPFTNKAVVFDQTLTKILKKSDASDIAAIPANGGYSTSGAANTPTPTQPGATATLTQTPTPTQPGATATLTPTPVPGNKAPTCSSLTSNFTTVTGTATLTLTCTGSDTDGNITAADFSFGDGQSKIVDSNSGSISTTHYYNTIGSIKATCKVKDNTGTWSTVSGACEKILSFKPASTPTPTQARSYGDRGAIATPTPTQYTGAAVTSPTATPIRIVGSVISETPDTEPQVPSSEPTLYPEEPSEPPATNNSGKIWWIVGGIIAIIVAFLLLRRKGPPPPPTGQIPLATG